MVRYLLKHKNDIGAEVLFDEEKGALSEVLSVCDESLLPLCSQNGHIDNLKIWWHNKAVPQSRSDIRHLLDKDERKDINKGWDLFWDSFGTEKA